MHHQDHKAELLRCRNQSKAWEGERQLQEQIALLVKDVISGHLLAAWYSPKGTVEAIFYAASFHCNMLKDVSKPIGCQTNEISGVGLVTF